MQFMPRLLPSVIMALLVVTLPGCGEKNVTAPTAATKLERSQPCFDCHGTLPSKITGAVIAEEWKLSLHNTTNAAGCIDCHFLLASDAQPHIDRLCAPCHSATPVTSSHTGLPPNAIRNPDSYGICGKCHNSVAGLGLSNHNNVTNNTLTSHFSTPTLSAYTSGTYKARYVSKNYENSCRSCHNPHDTTSRMNILRQWARSGKGDVSAAPWTNYDFRTRGTSTPGATPANSFGTDCVRCHTATGYINYLANKGIAPFGGTSKVEGKEVLACNACHMDYSYARRQVGAVTAFYNKSTANNIRIRIAITYPDIGESNLCLNCHVGRETGKIIKELADPTLTSNKITTPSGPYSFINTSFENSHYLTAGATVFKTSGFEFYSSYRYDNPSFYAHDKIGVGNHKNTGTSGPCITCHMKPDNHTFLPVAKDSSGNITALTSTACNNTLCHNGSMGVTEIEHQKELFNAAMDALKAMLQNKLAIYFFNANPYFFTKPYVVGYKESGSCSENLAVKNWQTGGTTAFSYSATTKSCRSATAVSGIIDTGANNMGAAFNYNLLFHDFGAFAHNRFYAKRLIYDSISWLYDNDIKASSNALGYLSDVEAAIQSSTALTPQQKSDACNYLFTSNTYTAYISKDSRNWRPGSSSSSPVY